LHEDTTVRAITIGASIFITLATISLVLIYYNTAKSSVQKIGTGVNVEESYRNDIEETLSKQTMTGTEFKNLVNYFYKRTDVNITITTFRVFKNDGTIETINNTSGTYSNINNPNSAAQQSAFDSMVKNIVPNQLLRLEKTGNNFVVQVNNDYTAIDTKPNAPDITSNPNIVSNLAAVNDPNGSNITFTANSTPKVSWKTTFVYNWLITYSNGTSENVTGSTVNRTFQEGNNSLRVTATDSDGLVSDETVYDFQVAKIRPTTPTITTNPFVASNGSVFSDANVITFTASSTSLAGYIAGYNWSLNGVLSSIHTSNITFTLPVGNNTISVTAVDNLGLVSDSATYNVNVVERVYNYAFNSTSQIFTVPTSGWYSLEIKGAQGGGNTGRGAQGGTAYGEIYLNANEVLNIFVGGTNGYNGGGISTNQASIGGGGTDIRRNGSSLTNRIIVARWRPEA
jgi:hypothetical protein